jgi:hypothetical protein
VTAHGFRAGVKPDGDRARRFAVPKPKGQRFKNLGSHPAIRDGTTIYPARVFHPSVLPRVFKSAINSPKIGKDVTKGKWAGMPIFTLTLEERRTCPRSCKVWEQCYGNNMHFADRIMAGGSLESRIWFELSEFQRDHPAGFVIRLHVLGDFYSLGYVELWAAALVAFPAMRVFGYTARSPLREAIGKRLFQLAAKNWDRFAIRFSGSGMSRLSTMVVRDPEDCPPIAIICPAQTGRTARCGTCALCWQSEKPIAFIEH